MTFIVVRLEAESGANCEISLDLAEMRHLPAIAFQVLGDMAKDLLPGKEIARLTYVDDEGDHCTLAAESIADALDFTESVDEGVNLLKLRVVTKTVPEAAAVAQAPPAEREQQQAVPAAATKRQDYHFNVVCDKSGMCPIVGKRYNKKGQDYDLCESEFNKLPVEAQAAFVCIASPGDAPVPAIPGAEVTNTCPVFEQDAKVAAFERLLEHSDPTVRAAAELALADSKAAMEIRFASPPHQPVVHVGVTCDVSGMCPIVGVRYTKRGENYDLCEAEFEKLSDEERADFIRVPLPGCRATVIEELESRHGWDESCLKEVVDSPFAALLESLLHHFPCEKHAEVGAAVEPIFGVPRDCFLPCLKEFQKGIESLRPAIEGALEAGEVGPALAGLSACCRDVVERAEECKTHDAAAVEAFVREVEGSYECHLYDQEGKNNWHFVELRRSPESRSPDLTWSNRAGVTWALTPSVDAYGIAKLLVASDCIYFADGHRVCEIQRDDEGRLMGVLGPHGELYTREPAGSPTSEKNSMEEHASEDDSASNTFEVVSRSFDTFSDASSETCRAQAGQVAMAAVVYSSLEVTRDQWMFEDVELRGDATKEFSELLKPYPNVTQAYRLGCVAISPGAGGNETTAVSKIVVQNTGAVPWSDFSSIRSVAGPSHGLCEMMLGAVPAGDKVEIVLDLTIKEGEGGRSAWAMCDQGGEPFGPLLLFESVHM